MNVDQSMESVIVRLLSQGLDNVSALQEFSTLSPESGAVVTFTGKVRPKRSDGTYIDYLYLDWYPGMTEHSLEAIARRAYDRFDVNAIMVLHRCGQVAAGDDIVFVAAASDHRRPAFEAADYLMDRLKSEAAFWKRESGDGGERWIEPTARDLADMKRWQNE